MKRLGIIFCGGCNPQYDRGALAANTVSGLDVECEVVYNTTDCDCILYLSGCSSNCAYKYNICDKPSVVVAGLKVDRQTVTAEQMPDLIKAKLNK